MAGVVDVVAALAFAAFVLIGRLSCVVTGPARKKAINALIILVLIVSFGGTVTRQRMWPFSSWNLMPIEPPTAIGDLWVRLRIVGVTDDGAEHRIDYRAWQPWSYAELVTWIDTRYPDLTEPSREDLGEYLLNAAEQTRQNARAGLSIGSWDRWFGSLSAPAHFFHRRRWTNPDSVPSSPFRQVRLYREYFELEAFRQNPDTLRLGLLFQYPPSP